MDKMKLILIVLAITFFTNNISAQSTKKIVVEDMDKAKLEKLIKNRKGKVLFLNIWASWCAPCKKEFPDLVRLAAKYKNSKVEFIGLSVDDRNALHSDVIPFLQQNKVNFKNYIQHFNSVEELLSFFPKWQGAIPLTVIYDKNGKEQKFIIGMRDFDYFDSAIKEVLASSK